jgi:hypothetical protein
MDENKPEMILTPDSSSLGMTLLFSLGMALFCFYVASNQEGVFSYILIGGGMIFIGLIFFLGFGSQDAYLKLTPEGMEFKFPGKKVTYVPWDEVEKLQIMEISNLNVVGITYTEESGRTKGLTKKMNNLFAKGADITLPTHYPIDLGDLYLLVYGWKLGYYIDDTEEVELNKIEIIGAILEYETALEHEDLDHFG